MMQYVRAHTNISVPRIIHHSVEVDSGVVGSPYITVPFRLIRQSRVTVPCGPALILVHVTRHFDFGRMRKMVQKKKL